MQNSVSTEINVVVSYFILGIICGVVFDFFKAWRFGKFTKTYQLIFQDVLYYCIISVIVYNFILNVNGADIRLYMVSSAIMAFLLYKFTFSRYVVRVLLWCKTIVKLILKIAFWPIKTISGIVFLPFLKIKQKLLSKKAKIALTFKRFCFKIKCNVGMLCVSKKICKERKPCRKEQKPEKKV